MSIASEAKLKVLLDAVQVLAGSSTKTIARYVQADTASTRERLIKLRKKGLVRSELIRQHRRYLLWFPAGAITEIEKVKKPIPTPISTTETGVDQEDLAWMAHYQQKREQRLARMS